MPDNKSRLTLSLDPDVRDWVDLTATRRRQTLSTVITLLIEQEQAREAAAGETSKGRRSA